MPISAVMAGVGAVASVGSSAIGALSGSGGEAGYGGGLSVTQQQYAIHGPYPGQAPTIGGSEKDNSVSTMTAPKATQGQSANPRSTPTQAVGTEQANQDYNNVWAARLSRYLDYNTRNLG